MGFREAAGVPYLCPWLLQENYLVSFGVGKRKSAIVGWSTFADVSLEGPQGLLFAFIPPWASAHREEGVASRRLFLGEIGRD